MEADLVSLEKAVTKLGRLRSAHKRRKKRHAQQQAEGTPPPVLESQISTNIDIPFMRLQFKVDAIQENQQNIRASLDSPYGSTQWDTAPSTSSLATAHDSSTLGFSTTNVSGLLDNTLEEEVHGLPIEQTQTQPHHTQRPRTPVDGVGVVSMSDV
eukprot:m.272847 g.272847  ORF g.272847 m.272847 type:complete len:155 (-) comp104272_c0_seq1:134-598(-)